ncbi:cyclase family protein [Micromonospora sp. NPDC005087]|uniref:cyclase family protein n=1 Tax=Micromonospora sp. NPDC005087 TaxID=3364225 RepID=UPI0036A1E256
MSDRLLDAVRTGVKVIDLGRQLQVGMPQSPNHPAFWHSHPRRHGDMVRLDGGSAANDMISTGIHVGTHIDALAHVSHDGKLHGGLPVTEALVNGKYDKLGAHTIEPMICRGLLLDIPRYLGVAGCEPGYEITVTDLEGACAAQGVDPGPGDVVLIRSGWGQKFAEGTPYVGGPTGVPGVSEAGAQWLASRSIRAAGADTIAFERLAPGVGHAVLPAHRVLLVEAGIYIIEALDLEGLSAHGWSEFTFVLVPLNIYGATGSPVRPLAVASL